jgi:hypothetical protein
MSDSEQNSHETRYQTSGPVWSVAAFSAFACLFSVLGAKVLSHWIDSDSVSRVAYERTMREVAANVAASASSAKTPQTYSIVRSLGIDGITTATIPHQKVQPVSPCGDDKAPQATSK